jgi:hypothetical protein
MNHNEIRALIGAYASGSLSEAQRRMLFEAALEDQDLFEELAGEHALKEILDQPGVKARLAASLAPAPAQKRKIWYWITASAGAAIAALVLVVVHVSHPPLREVAENRVSAPGPASIPSATDAITVRPEPQRSLAQPKTALRKPVPEAQPSPDAKTVTLASAPETPAAASPTPPPPALTPAPAGVEPQSARLNAPSPVTGFRAAPQILAVAPVQRFAFSYLITPERRLRVTPETSGFLTVIVSPEGSSPQSLVENQPIGSGTSSELPMPSGAIAAYIVFSAQPNISKEFPPALGGAIDPISGIKVDPNPSPDSRLTALIALPRP